MTRLQLDPSTLAPWTSSTLAGVPLGCPLLVLAGVAGVAGVAGTGSAGPASVAVPFNTARRVGGPIGFPSWERSACRLLKATRPH